MKGYIYTVEAAVAIAIVVVVSSALFSTPVYQPDVELGVIKHAGYDALNYLNEKGMLKGFVQENDESKIESQLDILLPENIGFETEICTDACSTVNVPDDRTVIGMNYFISSYNGNYIGKRVRLWVWKVV